MVSLRPISESNRAAVEALSVSSRQEDFGSGVADSLLEATAEPDGRAIYWAVYDDETPVGPISFYERYGFVQTGELVFDGAVLLWLDLRPR